MKTVAIITFLISVGLTPACAETTRDSAETDTVSTTVNGDTAALRQSIASAQNAQTISVAAGRYNLADLKLSRDITLVGDGDVVFYSTYPLAKGLINTLEGTSVRIENIIFEGARSPDLNGAGIRHDGKDLMVVSCTFNGNENGILATGRDDGQVSVVESVFIGNGHGDGYSHGIYMSSGNTLTIESSKFIGTKIGHHVKSLAGKTTITNSLFDDADGRTSYAVDASRGGAVSIRSNTFVHAADGDNSTLFNYDLSRGGEAVSLEITGNTITNSNRNGRLLRNDTALAPILHDNKITHIKGGAFRER